MNGQLQLTRGKKTLPDQERKGSLRPDCDKRSRDDFFLQYVMRH